MKSARTQAGFALPELILVSALVIILGAIGWQAWQNHLAATPASHVATSTTPRINPPTATPIASPTGKNLTIKEWGVKFPLTSGIADATYTISSGDVANISTAKLNSLIGTVGGCTAGLHGPVIQRSSSTDTGPSEWGPIHIGAYYYFPARLLEPACAMQLKPGVSEQINAIDVELQAAVRKLSAD